MTKEFTMEQIEKANEFAKFFAKVSDAVGYPDMELTKEIFNLVNGIEEKTETGLKVSDEDGKGSMIINSDGLTIFHGGVDWSEKLL